MKSRNIEFFSLVPGLVDTNPIIPASSYRPDWVSKARDDFKQAQNNTLGKFSHIYMCPGIFDVMKTGYIIPMWFDAIIECQRNGEFRFQLPNQTFATIVESYGQDTITSLEGTNQLIPHPPWHTSGDQILKILTPWKVIAPRGVKFLFLPYPYPDSYDFQSTIGILDPGISVDINAQCFWFCKPGEHAVIKAGTPLALLVPLSQETFNLEVRDATDKDRLWIDRRDFIQNSTHVPRRNLVKKAYAKYFHSPKNFFKKK